MSEAFNFGEPGKRRARRARAPRPPRAGGGGGKAKALMFGAAAAGLILVVSVFLKFVGSSGSQIAQDQATVVQQIDRSQDLAAQASAQNALIAEKTYYTQTNSYGGPGDLAGVDPSLQYTADPSTSVNTVSVASHLDAVGLSVFAPSGTCFYIKDTPSGTFYGSGTECTGQAALGASSASW